jgi:hypothetical protein
MTELYRPRREGRRRAQGMALLAMACVALGVYDVALVASLL